MPLSHELTPELYITFRPPCQLEDPDFNADLEYQKGIYFNLLQSKAKFENMHWKDNGLQQKCHSLRNM